MFDTAFNIAASGIDAAQTLLNITANNIANADTPGYQTENVDLSAMEDGGVSVDGISTNSNSIDADLDGSEGDNTAAAADSGLDSQLVNLSNARILYNANAAVIKITDQMYGNLIDVVSNATSDQDDDS